MPDPTPAPASPASPVANPAAAATVLTPDTAAPASLAAPAATPNLAAPANPAGQAAAAWPEAWRNEYGEHVAKDPKRAGKADKYIQRAERYATPWDLIDAGFEAQDKIRSGDFAKPLPANANDQEKLAWRQANGIPEKPDGYFDKLPGGLVIGADDKPMFDEVGKLAHDNNVPPAFMQGVVKWYYDMAEAKTAEVAEADKAHARETGDALRAKWGNDYRANINQVGSMLDSLGGDLKAQLMDATLPDGRRLFNSPEIVEWFAAKARELNPAGIIIPGGGENQVATIDAEIADIKKLMGNKQSDYWKGPKADGMQARYRQLIEAKQKLASRAA